MRLNKFGNPAGGKAAPGMMMGMDMGLGSGINGIEKGLIMGQAVPFQVAGKSAGAPSIKGTIRLASIKNGVARIDQVFDMAMGQANMTMHGKGSFFLRVKDGTMLSTQMVMTGNSMGGATTMNMSIRHL